MNERWLPIPGYEGLYEVSDAGRCRSVECKVASRNRWGPITRTKPAKVLRPQARGPGYLGYQLSRNGKVSCVLAHRMVALAFHGPAPAGTVCAHLDGTRTNNTPANLAWVTPKENQSHRVVHGTSNRGGAAHQAKLTEKDVIAARQMRFDGKVYREIAEHFGVHISTIQHALSGKNWTHIG